MIRHESRLFDATLGHSIARAIGALALMTSAALAHGAVALDPFLAGNFGPGTGANAKFITVDGTLNNSLMYWNGTQASSTPQAGYTLLREQAWGTGIWGLADWNNINRSGTSAFTTTGQASLIASTISFGDSQWSACVAGPAGCGWAADTWKAAGALLPTVEQDNWTSLFTGYIRITDADDYNFRVLFDDGFFLKLWGAESALSSPFEISSDFLTPRTYMSFLEGFQLSAGLYKFELGAYDRLETGVVQLEWMRGTGAWEIVPTANLLAALPADAGDLPAPGTFPLVMAAGGALLLVGARRKRR